MRHILDRYPVPADKPPIYVNEPWLIDLSLWEGYPRVSEPEAESDNVRVYVPIDINREAILRKLFDVIWHYEKATEKNEFAFSADVEAIVFQIEIYDQAWQTVHKLKNGEHSIEAISLVRDFVNALKEIPDGCAELFPFEMIDELEKEYLTRSSAMLE
jgi:hypothetical protein